MNHRGNDGYYIARNPDAHIQPRSNVNEIIGWVMVALMVIALVIAASAVYQAVSEAVVLTKLTW
jgi:hypothetical protein